jgi:hypothetical protein
MILKEEKEMIMKDQETKEEEEIDKILTEEIKMRIKNLEHKEEEEVKANGLT